MNNFMLGENKSPNIFLFQEFVLYLYHQTNKTINMMTIAQLENAFNILNSMYFENALPNVTIKYCNSKGYMGLFCPRKDKFNRCTIKINKYYDITDIDAENILAHETIHLWQHINNYKDSHGSSFIRKMNEINKYGKHYVDIKDCRKLEMSDSSLAKMKTSFVLVWEGSSTDSKYISRIATLEKLLATFKRMSKYKFNYYKLTAYEVKHPYVEKLINCRKRISSYCIDDKIWNDIINSAVKEIAVA